MTEPTRIPAQITLNEESPPDRIYVNGAVVNHSDFDFTINFFEFLPPLKPVMPEGEGPIQINVPIVARIGMTGDLVPKLIKALQINYEAYLEESESIK